MPFAEVIGHERTKRQLRTLLHQGHMAHAFLFAGDEAIGKRLLALCFAQVLSCERLSETLHLDACGQCRACRQVMAGTHPDVLLIEPDYEAAYPQIKIEHVRYVEQHVMYRPFIADYKICIMNDADRLTINAANALLKTLEEPPDHSLFLLITSRPAVLPATVRSRCLTLTCTPPTLAQVEKALMHKQALPQDDARFLAKFTGGRIGLAFQQDLQAIRRKYEETWDLLCTLARTSTPELLEKAEQYAKNNEESADLVMWLTHWLRDLLIVAMDGSEELLVFSHQAATLRRWAAHLDKNQLFHLLESVQELEQAPKHNRNMQLTFETFFWELRDTLAPCPVS
ncbi:MAG: DNA polymerase III subunit delta' [Nitrospirae bacterium]|nr:MAG: DNA polymerase III subunit delta' [Nitrospirota bacterium]